MDNQFKTLNAAIQDVNGVNIEAVELLLKKTAQDLKARGDSLANHTKVLLEIFASSRTETEQACLMQIFLEEGLPKNEIVGGEAEIRPYVKSQPLFHLVIQRNTVHLAEVLLEYGYDLHQVDEDAGRNALDVAAIHGRLKSFFWLRDQGLKPLNSSLLLRNALTGKNEDIVHDVFNKEAPDCFKGDFLSADVGSIIFDAVFYKMSPKTLDELLQAMSRCGHDFDPQENNSGGENILHYLAEYGEGVDKLILWCLEQGVNPHQISSGNLSPLKIAKGQNSPAAALMENWLLAQQEKEVLAQITEGLTGDGKTWMPSKIKAL